MYGRASNTSGTTYGVYGETNSASGFGGYFVGPVGSQNYFQRSVGIGTTNPASTLTVLGTADFSGPVAIGIGSADARLLVRGVPGEDAFRVRVDSASKLVVKDNGGLAVGSNYGTVPANGMRVFGDVGVGGADPGSFTFAVNGDAAKPDGGLWSTFSDRRLKRHIEPLESGVLDRLLAIHGYTFEYTDDAVRQRLALPGRRTGLIAQEVRDVFPGWVDADAEGYLYVTERGLTAIVVEALRELRSEKDAEIAELNARLERLEALLTNP
ncbi:MAG: tail fiber domain-containing protein [Phycisphaerales bacterium]|nr:tail fiber domain-containing protein [Phycisphaerales bacterium]